MLEKLLLILGLILKRPVHVCKEMSDTRLFPIVFSSQIWQI